MGRRIQRGGDGLAAEGRQGQQPHHGQHLPGRVAHLGQALLQEHAHALLPPLAVIQGVQRRLAQPLQVLGGALAGLVQVLARQAHRQGQAAHQVADPPGGPGVGGAVAAPLAQQVHGVGGGQRLHVLPLGQGVLAGAAGDQHAAAPAHAQHGSQVGGLLGAIEDEQGALAGQGAQGGLGGRGPGLFAEAEGDVLQGQGRVGLTVEAVEEDAVGEAVGGFVAGGEGPDGLGGEGGLADAAGAAEGDDAAGVEVG